MQSGSKVTTIFSWECNSHWCERGQTKVSSRSSRPPIHDGHFSTKLFNGNNKFHRSSSISVANLASGYFSFHFSLLDKTVFCTSLFWTPFGTERRPIFSWTQVFPNEEDALKRITHTHTHIKVMENTCTRSKYSRHKTFLAKTLSLFRWKRIEERAREGE